MVSTPDGKLWVGGAPNYGIRGGPLGWYDTKTAARGFHRQVLPDTSPNCLLWLPALQQLLIGLGTEPGSGVSVQRPDGAFALWDTVEDRLVHAGDYGLKNLAEVCSFVSAGHSGLVYALTARPNYMVKDYGARPAPIQVALINPAGRCVVASAEVPASLGPLPEFSADSLRCSADGRIFLVLAGGVCRVDPDSCAVTPVWNLPDEKIDVTGPIVGQRLFFASQWKLRCLDLP
jgi:hypothetical protein